MPDKDRPSCSAAPEHFLKAQVGQGAEGGDRGWALAWCWTQSRPFPGSFNISMRPQLREPCDLSPNCHHHTKAFWARALGPMAQLPLPAMSQAETIFIASRICYLGLLSFPIPDQN